MNTTYIVLIVIGALLLIGGIIGAIIYDFYLKKKGINKRTKPSLIDQSTKQFNDFFNRREHLKKLKKEKQKDTNKKINHSQIKNSKKFSKDNLSKKYEKIISDVEKV